MMDLSESDHPGISHYTILIYDQIGLTLGDDHR